MILFSFIDEASGGTWLVFPAIALILAICFGHWLLLKQRRAATRRKAKLCAVLAEEAERHPITVADVDQMVARWHGEDQRRSA